MGGVIAALSAIWPEVEFVAVSQWCSPLIARFYFNAGGRCINAYAVLGPDWEQIGPTAGIDACRFTYWPDWGVHTDECARNTCTETDPLGLHECAS